MQEQICDEDKLGMISRPLGRHTQRVCKGKHLTDYKQEHKHSIVQHLVTARVRGLPVV